MSKDTKSKKVDDDEWIEIDPDEIKKGMYVRYENKPFQYQNGKYTKKKMNSGGYITFINTDDKFFGCKNKYGKQWSVQMKNVDKILISPKEYIKYFDND